ncbi:peptidoglycan bridge formation glycyltransferase FemA/FemB family protein [soil metagenome]
MAEHPGTAGTTSPPAAPDLEALRADDRAWDAFVEASDAAFPLQLSAWAVAKATTGWSAARVVADVGSGPIGGQVLVRRIGPGPYSIGYLPRGPVATRFDRESVTAFTGALRRFARERRLTHVTADTGLEGEGHADLLRAAGWQPGDTVQHQTSQVIDLTPDETALWSDVYKSTRRYVNGGRRNGCTVHEGGEEQLPEFYRILAETARRSGFIPRSPEAYRDVYRAFAAGGRARILIGRLPDGTAVSSKLILRSGGRDSQLYGGLSDAGGEARAGHFFEWEAILRSKAAGATLFDMWGRSTSGIAHFKQGFGGRTAEYCGTWDLVTSPLARSLYLAGRRGFVWLARRRHGLGGPGGSGPAGGGDGGPAAAPDRGVDRPDGD